MRPQRCPTPSVLVVSTIVLLLGWTASMAGDYHFGATLDCRECHVMHYSQSHGYSPTVIGGGGFIPIGGSGPYTYLLRNEVNDLCLTCHDGSSFAPDVLDANTGAAVRNAGALNRSGTAPYTDLTGHTLDTTDAPPGGATWTPDSVLGLICTDCHQPHGYGGYGFNANPWRNLAGGPGDGTGGALTYNDTAPGTLDSTKDVFQRSWAPGFHYDVATVDYNEPDTTASAYADWCKNCHPNFHGAVGGPEIGGSTASGHFDRHPAAGVDIGAIGGGHSNNDVYWLGHGAVNTKNAFVKVMSANTSTGWPVNGTTYGTVGDADLTPSCFSCHKAHGNQNAFGLIYMEDVGTVTEQGTATGQYRDLCRQCHVQGG